MVTIPVLRKDFIIDRYQIFESRAAGADAILLISELLRPQQINDFLQLARELDLSTLLESHGRLELITARESEALILGVNSRDLKTLRVDLKSSLQLLPLIPPHRIRVAESGIKSADDVRRLSEAGADAILVGETLVRSKDPVRKIKELIDSTHKCP
jgi:indole-3-glycerol phosphate synthase